jgi:hypothetical protein
MIKTKQEMIIEGLQKIKGIGDFQLIANTLQVANKKSRITKIATPENLTEVTKVAFVTISLGDNYTEAVNNQRLLEGKTDDFKAKATYCSPLSQINNDLIRMFLKKIGINLTEKSSEVIYKHDGRDQYYVRVYPSLAKEYQVTHVFFDAFGEVIPNEQWKELQKHYFKMPSPNKSQGLEKQVIVNNYKLENVLYLGDKKIEVINELTEEHLKVVGLR